SAPLSYAASLQDLSARAVQEKWDQDPQWLRLGHYKKNLWQSYVSETNASKFFLANDGVTNPHSELLATLTALYEGTRLIRSSDGKFNEPASCVFPARKLWLEKKSGVTFPQAACERYERYKEILQPQSLTYVFSSYYLNNPASGFGHTFLRVNKAPSSRDGERYELADFGIGYAAVMVSDNPFVYSFLGVSGMLPGVFDVHPYYFKVREYNDFESRDLWEYDLSFTPEEVQMIVAHIWELSDVNFNYYYFSENCAYRILSVLEVARPEINLLDKLKTQVMPADTVQIIAEQPGLVSQVHYRPSVRATFQSRYRPLTADLQERVQVFAKNESLSELSTGLDQKQQQQVLDAAIDYLDYRYPKEILKKEGKYSFKKEVLLARAEVGGISEPLHIPTPWNEAPEKSLGSRRLTAGYRSWEHQDYALLGLKFSLHDLLDPKIGYPPTAQITMGDLLGSWNSKSKEIALEKATLFEVISLAPLDPFTHSPSWRLYVSVDRGYENNCEGLCRWTELSGGIGLTKSIESFDGSIWLRTTGQASDDFTGDTWRIGAGPSLMLRYNKDSFSLLGEIYYRYDYKGEDHEIRQLNLGGQWTPFSHLGVRVSGQSMRDTHQFNAQLMYYY
ncbi:MAG TPA: DUF4105 domain-containing protein, partial [Bdellovibrio sp.]|nr:DUF4105 domain-containing protein [Bdellovibrio sp.]